MSIIWLARVSEGFSTGRVELIFSTGRANWHGSHGSARVKHGFARVVQYFLFFEVGTLIFHSIQGYFDLRILIGLIKDPMNEFG